VDNRVPPVAGDPESGARPKKISTMSVDLWLRGCERLATELPEHQFNTWIRPLPEPEVRPNGDADVVSVRVSNRFKLDWIRAQYAGRIEGVLSEIAGKPIRLELMLAARVAEAGTPAPRPGMALTAAAALNGTVAGASAPATPAEAAPPPPRHKLNPSLTFDTLVPGRANQMARTAALHVAGAPGAMYNPLFIYGGVGLGKTHLVHAVGNALLKDRPDARVNERGPGEVRDWKGPRTRRKSRCLFPPPRRAAAELCSPRASFQRRNRAARQWLVAAVLRPGSRLRYWLLPESAWDLLWLMRGQFRRGCSRRRQIP